MIFGGNRGAGGGTFLSDRLRGQAALYTDGTNVEEVNAFMPSFDTMGGYINNASGSSYNLSGNTYVRQAFKRAPGFMDVVCYTGTFVARTVAHNLGVVPEMMIVKIRGSISGAWEVYSGSATSTIRLNTTNPSLTSSAEWNNTAPTASVFTVGNGASVNDNSRTYVAYLFATLAGVSKVGSYTGTGTTLAIDCGFAAGARFVMIKRTDSTGDWYVWDTARGIIAGNDPYLLMNSTAAEVTNTDYIDPLSAGFTVTSTAPAAINANGGSFIYLAIA